MEKLIFNITKAMLLSIGYPYSVKKTNTSASRFNIVHSYTRDIIHVSRKYTQKALSASRTKKKGTKIPVVYIPLNFDLLLIHRSRKRRRALVHARKKKLLTLKNISTIQRLRERERAHLHFFISLSSLEYNTIYRHISTLIISSCKNLEGRVNRNKKKEEEEEKKDVCTHSWVAAVPGRGLRRWRSCKRANPWLQAKRERREQSSSSPRVASQKRIKIARCPLDKWSFKRRKTERDRERERSALQLTSPFLAFSLSILLFRIQRVEYAVPWKRKSLFLTSS